MARTPTGPTAPRRSPEASQRVACASNPKNLLRFALVSSPSARLGGGRGNRPATDPYLDASGHIVLPDGINLSSLLDRNIAECGDDLAYRYIDYSHHPDGKAVELTWSQVGTRSQAIGARLQQVTARGDRVAVLAPQGLEYVTGFFAAIQAGNIAVPLFAPELPGHAERLEAVLGDAQPAVVLTTAAVSEAVQKFVRMMPRDKRPRIIAVDEIPDSVGTTFAPSGLGTDDIAYLQYTSGSTRVPTGVEISHRAAGTNLLQMVMSIGLGGRLRRSRRQLVAALPRHGLDDDRLSAAVRRPCDVDVADRLRPQAAALGQSLGQPSRSTATSSRRRPTSHSSWLSNGVSLQGENIDLSDVVLINGSEPVNIDSIEKFTETFLPYGLSKTAVRPSYGMAEATLFVSSIQPDTEPSVVYLDRETDGRRSCRPGCARTDPKALAQVSCGQVSLSQWAAIVDPDTEEELPDGCVGEIWLHGANIGRGYWARPEETQKGLRQRAGGPAGDGKPRGRRARRRDLDAHRRPRRLPRRRAVHHRSHQGHGDSRRPQPLPAGHRGDSRRGVHRRFARVSWRRSRSRRESYPRQPRRIPARSW